MYHKYEVKYVAFHRVNGIYLASDVLCVLQYNDTSHAGLGRFFAEKCVATTTRIERKIRIKETSLYSHLRNNLFASLLVLGEEGILVVLIFVSYF